MNAGPCDLNEDGSEQQCFLEWQDEKNGTNNYEYYQKLHKKYRFWPGVQSESRCPVPPGTHPELPIPYKAFVKFYSGLDMSFRKNKIDACATCALNHLEMKKLKAKKKKMSKVDKKALKKLRKAQKDHLLLAAKSYADRKKRVEQSKNDWKNVVFDNDNPPTPQQYPNKHDFIQCDMGGGLETPWINVNVGYYLRTLNSKPYYICGGANGTCLYWWNETIAGCGSNAVSSVLHKYVTEKPTGAGTLDIWGDGTFSQLKNQYIWKFMADLVNPDSPTYVKEEGKSLYRGVNYYNGESGHTRMAGDAAHGVVVRNGKGREQVASLLDWVKVGLECGFFSVLMEQAEFLDFKGYLNQMYVTTAIRRKGHDGKTIKMVDYRWANAGYGRRMVNGTEQWVSHPHTIWLRKCKGNEEEWWKEEPVVINVNRAMHPDNTHTQDPKPILDWIKAWTAERRSAW